MPPEQVDDHHNGTRDPFASMHQQQPVADAPTNLADSNPITSNVLSAERPEVTTYGQLSILRRQYAFFD